MKQEFEIIKCSECNGSGLIEVRNCNCYDCNINYNTCKECNGKGDIKVLKPSKNNE